MHSFEFGVASESSLGSTVGILGAYSLRERLLFGTELVSLCLTYAAAGWAVVVLRKDPRAWVLLTVAAYFILVAGPAGGPRFRVPAMPYLVLLAAVGLMYPVRAARLLATHRSRAGLPPAATGS